MKAQLARHWFKIVTVVLLLIIVGAIGLQIHAKNELPVYKIISKAPNFQLQSIDGQNISLESTNGKVRLVYFFYTSCPDVCLPTTMFLSKIQDALLADNEFVNKADIFSITFDPKVDTVAKLHSFAKSFHADNRGWLFLRGDEQETVKIARTYNVAVIRDKNGAVVTHTNTIALVDKNGNVRHYYNANDPSLTPAIISNDMERLIKERT